MASPFDVLLIESDADEETIRQAYRERVKETHPDQGGSLEEFQAVRTAYEKLVAGYSESGEATRNGDSAGEDDGDEDWYRFASSTVTYLDYDVIADSGWDPFAQDLFRRADAADLDEEDFGQFEVRPGESLLEAAEKRGFAWPFACRGGACANCAILLREGELSMPVSHVLPARLMERGFRLSCNGIPITDELAVVFNVKHMPELDELLLPPRPFEEMYADD